MRRRSLPICPLLVVQFIDERHVRVFGRGSLFEAVMQRLGLRNAPGGERPMPGDSRSRAWSSFSGCRMPGWWWWTLCP